MDIGPGSKKAATVCADEIDMIRRAQQGDREAFGHLMHLHTGAIYNFACRFLPAKDDVDDVVQDVFLKAFRNLHRFDPSRRRFRSWLFRITANTSLDLLKKRRTVSGYARQQASTAPAFSEPRALSERFYHNSKDLKSVLQDLPGRERQAVLLFYYHDLTQREIADVLGIPLGTVKSRLRSAIHRLRGHLL